jgi:hypothetical protein
MASKTQETLSLLFGPRPGGPPEAISRIRMIFVDRGHGPPSNMMQRDAKMTRGKEDAACSATENGYTRDSVRMLYLNHSSGARLMAPRGSGSGRGSVGLARRVL